MRRYSPAAQLAGAIIRMRLTIVSEEAGIISALMGMENGLRARFRHVTTMKYARSNRHDG
jgi:hypothetical protein